MAVVRQVNSELMDMLEQEYEERGFNGVNTMLQKIKDHNQERIEAITYSNYDDKMTKLNKLGYALGTEVLQFIEEYNTKCPKKAFTIPLHDTEKLNIIDLTNEASSDVSESKEKKYQEANEIWRIF